MSLTLISKVGTMLDFPYLDEAFALIQGPWAWALYFFCALMIGMSKTGIQNIGTLAVPFFALLFGAKQSTGIVLILLCMADLMAVIYYRKQFLWAEVRRLLPAALIGLVIALLIGQYVDDKSFKMMMGCCLLLGVLLMYMTAKLPQQQQLTQKGWYGPLFGFIAGFSTMIGNAAGPALAIYLLSKKLDKLAFVATGAWFIMILNYTKIPLQAFVWHNISWSGLVLNLLAVPFIIAGGVLGIYLVKIIPEKIYKRIITTLIIVSSLLLIL